MVRKRWIFDDPDDFQLTRWEALRFYGTLWALAIIFVAYFLVKCFG
jgi:hypothetical protein